MLACPFHVPRYEWRETHPLVRKCDMCAERQREGMAPACVTACPHGALAYGERDALLSEAQERIAAAPARYLNHVWGKQEYGGTCVLYISDVDLATLDWPAPQTSPIPALTESLIRQTPVIGLSMASGLLCVSWIIRRRMKLAGARPQPEKDGADE